MRHLKSGRKLGVSAPHRKAMIRSLALALLENERIRTTPARAKELRHMAERLVTLAKSGTLPGRRQVLKLLGTTQTRKVGQNRVRLAMERLYSSLAPRFKDRAGGYTQIIRLPRRRGDQAEQCLMRYLPEAEKKSSASKKKGAAKKKSAKAAPAKKAKAADKSVKAKAPKESAAKASKKEAPQDKATTKKAKPKKG